MRLSDAAIVFAMIAFIIGAWTALAWAFGFAPGRAALFGCLWGATCMLLIWRMACKRLPDEPPGEKVTWRTGR